MSKEEEGRVREGAIFAIAAHYDKTVSTGSIHIEGIKRLNIDDWRIQAKFIRLTKELYVELIVFCNSYMFDVLRFHEVGSGI